MCDRASDPSQHDIPTPDPAIFGTGQGIKLNSQVVVAGQGMGIVRAMGCPAGLPEHDDHLYVVIEGDTAGVCYPRNITTLYADIYAGTDETDGDREARLVAEGDAITDAYYESER